MIIIFKEKALVQGVEIYELKMKILFVICVSVLLVSAQLIEYNSSDKANDPRYHSANFHASNCHGHNLPINFMTVKMLPDPLQLSGENVRISVKLIFNLTIELGAGSNQLELDLSLRLKTPHGYTEICSIVGESVCHYNDLCSRLPEVLNIHICEQFPKFCSCPLKPMEYTLPLNIPVNPLPFLLKGTFEGTVAIKQLGKTVGCLEVHFCVTECLF